MPWVCTSTIIPAARGIAAGIRHAGKRVRGHMRHTWGMSHRSARRVYGTLVTCVFVGAPVAGGAAWGPSWWSWPGPGAGFFGQPAGGIASAGILPIAVPEPSSLTVFALAVGALALIRGRA